MAKREDRRRKKRGQERGKNERIEDEDGKERRKETGERR